jgi:hypothetical protein
MRIESIKDVNSIDELNSLIGDDKITEEEYQDLVSYIQNKNRENNIEKDSEDADVSRGNFD